MPRYRINFGYEQASPDEADRMYGFYITDDKGVVVMSEDTPPSAELVKRLTNGIVEAEDD